MDKTPRLVLQWEIFFCQLKKLEIGIKVFFCIRYKKLVLGKVHQ